MKNKTKEQTAVTSPLRVPLKEAARLLSVCVKTLRKMVQAGEFTITRSSGDMRGSKIYLRSDEIAVYVAGDLKGLREFRAKKSRDAKAK